AFCGAAQRDVGARADQARRADRRPSAAHLHRLSDWRAALSRHAAGPGGAGEGQAGLLRAARMGPGPERRALARRSSGERPALPRTDRRARGVKLSMVGVGAAREAVIVLENPFSA